MPRPADRIENSDRLMPQSAKDLRCETFLARTRIRAKSKGRMSVRAKESRVMVLAEPCVQVCLRRSDGITMIESSPFALVRMRPMIGLSHRGILCF